MRKAKQIFQGAVDIFAEKGFDRATMDEVAERSGVAKGTLYYHFNGKEELIAFLMEEGVRQLILRVTTDVGETKEPLEQLRKAILAQVSFFDENREFCTLLLKGVWANADRQKQFREILQNYFGHLTKILVAGMEEKKFRQLSTDWATAALFGLIAVVSIRVILNGEPINRQELADYLFQQYVYGAQFVQ